MNVFKKLLPGLKYFFTLRFFFPAVLILLWFIIVLNNYIPGTILSGWDTLHPEFNFSLNFERLIFGVWREEQGLGAVAAHAHMSDLPRVFLLWVSSFIFPIEFLRFFIISLCLLSGILGVYYFIKNVFFDSLKNFYAGIFAFLGSLYYLFNLGTVQHFYVPFEMFTFQYALLPWIFFSVVHYLKKPTNKRLYLVGLANFFATPMAYAPLLWYVYFGSLCLFLLLFFFKQKKSVFSVILITIFVNSFWILPNLYFLISGNAALVPDAKINKLFSEEAYLQNASFGTISNVIVFKNFLFNWPVYVGFDRFDYLLTFWRNHVATLINSSIGFGTFAFAFFGMIGSIFNKKRYAIGLLLPLLVAFFFMLGSTYPLSLVSDFMRESSSLFKEALRFPFTKFSIVAMFSTAVFFGLGNYYFFNLVCKLFSRRMLPFLGAAQVSIIAILLVIYCFPMFRGQLISPLMQVKIPSEYTQVFDFLNSSEDGRVVVFPIHSFWGWIYYDWGFQGAQFITFGIKQPVLDRDWDRWNPKNEDFYRQLAYAVYSDNEKLVENVLNKYQIRYLVIDENIIAAGSELDNRSLNINQTKLLLNRIPQLSPVAAFKDIHIYKYNQEFDTVTLGRNLPIENKDYFTEDVDYSYSEKGSYLVKPKGMHNLVSDNLNFLLPSMISVSENETKIRINQPEVGIKGLLNKEVTIPVYIYANKVGSIVTINMRSIYGKNQSDGFNLQFGGVNTNDVLINFDNYQTLAIQSLTEDFTYQGLVSLNTKQFNNIALYESSEGIQTTITDQSVQNPKIVSDAEKGLIPDFPINLCIKPGENQVFGSSDITNGSLTITAKNSKACVWIPLSKILDSNAITSFKTLVGFRFMVNAEANSLGRFCLFDEGRQRCVLEQKYVLSGDEKTVYFLTDPNLLDHTHAVLYLDGTQKDTLEKITYTDLSVQYIKPREIKSISHEELSALFNKNDISSNEFTITHEQNQFVIDLFEQGHTDTDCTSLQATKSERKVENNAITYISDQGSSCDYFSLPNLSHAYGYILEVDSKNSSGLPLRVCIANPYSKRCDIYTTLKINKEFAKDYLLIPPIFDGGVGYDIHFDNYAVGEFTSENSIRGLRLLPIPYNFLRSTYPSVNKDSQSVIRVEMKKMLPGMYISDPLDLETGTTIIFNQAYDRGWVASVGKHVLVNGWQNGWTLDTQTHQRVLIFFLPDLLELISLLVILFVGLPVGFKLLSKHDKING